MVRRNTQSPIALDQIPVRRKSPVTLMDKRISQERQAVLPHQQGVLPLPYHGERAARPLSLELPMDQPARAQPIPQVATQALPQPPVQLVFGARHQAPVALLHHLQATVTLATPAQAPLWHATAMTYKRLPIANLLTAQPLLTMW